MHHPPDIAFIYAHAESHRGTNHAHIAVDKRSLRRLAHSCAQTGMIACRTYTDSLQRRRHVLGLRTAQAINYARIVGIFRHELAHTPYASCLARVGRHFDAYVWTIETAYPRERTIKSELIHNIVPRKAVGCGRKRHHRHTGQRLFHIGKFRVHGTEIMSPLRYAVGLVDGHEPYRQTPAPRTKVGHKSFGRSVQQFHAAETSLLKSLTHLILGTVGMDGGSRNAVGHQRRHLIVHQSDKRRHHHAHAVGKQRRKLIAKRLSASRRHQGQCIAA